MLFEEIMLALLQGDQLVALSYASEDFFRLLSKGHCVRFPRECPRHTHAESSASTSIASTFRLRQQQIEILLEIFMSRYHPPARPSSLFVLVRVLDLSW